MKVQYYDFDDVNHNRLKFAVIISKHDGKWVLCKHNQRIWEVPSTATPQGAMEQAEEWLREMGLIQVYAR